MAALRCGPPSAAARPASKGRLPGMCGACARARAHASTRPATWPIGPARGSRAEGARRVLALVGLARSCHIMCRHAPRDPRHGPAAAELCKILGGAPTATPTWSAGGQREGRGRYPGSRPGKLGRNCGFESLCPTYRVPACVGVGHHSPHVLAFYIYIVDALREELRL